MLMKAFNANELTWQKEGKKQKQKKQSGKYK
jgi:hypothetical protein